MKKTCLIVGIALASLLVLGFAGISCGQEFFVKDGGKTIEGPRYVPMEIIVKFKPGVSSGVVREINQKHGTSVLSTSRFAGFKRLRMPRGRTVEQMVAIYKKNPNVEYAEPNFIAHAFLVPNDPLYSYQWHLDNNVTGGIGMEEAWGLSTGASVIVAVIDTGVAYEDYVEAVSLGKSGKFSYITYEQAPDLVNTNFVVVPGSDLVNDDDHPNDDEGHGTHVAGTIAQSTNNGIGVAGVAYDCSIMPVKVLDSAGSGTYADIADGIYFAADNGAQVINMSLGGSVGSVTLEAALASAYGDGVTIVCASGNNGSATTVSYPAAYDTYCIAVGATRYNEEVSYYSNGGSSLDLTAPGGDINVDQNSDGYGDGVLQQTHDGSDYTNFGYYFYQGTSMASPHVAGVAALVIANGVVGPDAVRAALQASAEDKGDLGWDPAYGWGIVDAAAALGYSAVPNNQPEAEVGGPYTGTEGVAVDFDGSGSYDLDVGDTLTYAWDFGDGSTGAGVNPTHVYTAGGEYDVTLVVNDGKEDSFPSNTTADITEVNDPPVADAGGPYTGTIDVAITFDGSGSYDIDDGIASYAWDFGDGSLTEAGVNPTHTYEAGTYTVTLTVTDVGGFTGTDTATVTVAEAADNTVHVANIEMAIKIAGINTSALATITIVDAEGVPIQGATVSGVWSDAASGSDSGITDAKGQVTVESDKVKRPPSGTTFTFTVTDVSSDWIYDSDASDETSNSITVP